MHTVWMMLKLRPRLASDVTACSNPNQYDNGDMTSFISPWYPLIHILSETDDAMSSNNK